MMAASVLGNIVVTAVATAVEILNSLPGSFLLMEKLFRGGLIAERRPVQCRKSRSPVQSPQSATAAAG